MNFNEEQLAVINDHQKNLVVTAGAGAGKTAVLSSRFEALLQHGLRTGECDITGILTLTFTNKAATEMAQRIRKTLIESENPRIKEEASRIDLATISTLDSFSLSIVKGHFHRYGLPANSGIDDQKLESLIRQESLQWLIEKASQPALKKMIEAYSFKTVWEDLLCDLALKKFSLVESLAFPEKIENQILFVQKKYQEELPNVKECFSLLKQSGWEQKSWLDFIQMVEDHFHKKGEELSDLVAFIKTLPLPSIPGRVKEEQLPLKALIQEIKKFFQTIPEYQFFLDFQKDYRSIYDLLADYEKRILKARRAKGLLTFSEIAQMAVDLLKNDFDLRQFYKKKFRYIMVDEFQDNNLLQKELLYLLAEKITADPNKNIPTFEQLASDKLFFVGDEKQSIYLFRGADVSVFKMLGNELTQKTSDGKTIGEKKSLSINYRSEPGLINYFNRFFEGYMNRENSHESYEAVFEKLGARKANLPSKSQIRLIKVYGDPKEPLSDFDRHQNEAYRLASLIHEWIENQYPVSDGVASSRPCGYEDFCILFKKSSHQIAFEKVFNEFQIPINSSIVKGFFSGSLFNDFFSFFDLLLYPTDLVAYAAVLRSPICALNDDEVFKLLLEAKENSTLSGWSPFSTALPLWEDDPLSKKVFDSCREWYEKLSTQLDQLPIAVLLDELWFSFGLRNAYLSDIKKQSLLPHFDFLRNLAMEADEQGYSFSQFVALYRDFQNNEDRKLEKPIRFTSPERAVSIMSIHASKGLQFPIVILADANPYRRFNSKHSPLWYDHKELGPTLFYKKVENHLVDEKKVKSSFLYNFAKEEEKKKEAAEEKRLLYVALTRAKDHLIVSANYMKREKGKTAAKSFFDSLEEDFYENRSNYQKEDSGINIELQEWEAIDVRLFSYPQSKAASFSWDFEKEIHLMKLPPIQIPKEKAITTLDNSGDLTAFSNPLEQNPFCETGELLPSLSIDPFLIKEKKFAEFGTFCHQLIEMQTKVPQRQLTFSDNDWLFPQSLLLFEPKDRLEIKKAALELCQAWFSSDRYQLIKQTKWQQMLFEAPILLCDESLFSEGYLSGRVDLLLESSDEILILDFKTDRYKREKAHQLQLECYQKAYQAIAPQKRIKTELIYLRELKQ